MPNSIRTESENEKKWNESITRQVLKTDLYRGSDVIYAYADVRHEVSTRGVIDAALAEGKKVALPRVDGQNMDFYYIESYNDMESGYFGLEEPKRECPIASEKTALILVPGVAFTREGDRVGYGGGFYDRFFEREPDHPTIGLAFGFQIYPQLPLEPTDRRVDAVITEQD